MLYANHANKEIVQLWFKSIWGDQPSLSVVDQLGAYELIMQYPLVGILRGRDAVKNTITGFRQAFPNLNFWIVGDLIGEGKYVVGRWEGGGTHIGPALTSLPVGQLPASSGRKMRFTGMTLFKIENGKIAEEIGEEDSLTALQQLGLVPAGNWPILSTT